MPAAYTMFQLRVVLWLSVTDLASAKRKSGNKLYFQRGMLCYFNGGG